MSYNSLDDWYEIDLILPDNICGNLNCPENDCGECMKCEDSFDCKEVIRERILNY